MHNPKPLFDHNCPTRHKTGSDWPDLWEYSQGRKEQTRVVESLFEPSKVVALWDINRIS